MSSVHQAEPTRASGVQRAERPSGARRGAERLYLVGGERGQEPPDVRITEEDRRLVRQLVEELESALSAELLVHLACGAEAAAQRKRSLEAST
jgi:hypothetical protein